MKLFSFIYQEEPRPSRDEVKIILKGDCKMIATYEETVTSFDKIDSAKAQELIKGEGRSGYLYR